MTSDSAIAIEYPTQRVRADRPGVWVPVILMGLYWGYIVVSNAMEMPMFPRFMSQMGAFVLVGLIFLGWWLFNRRVKWADKLMAVAAMIIAPVIAKILSDKSMGPFPIINGLPLVLSAWALWMLLAQRAGYGVWKVGLFVMIFVAPQVFTLIRAEGLTGGGMPDVRWRWQKSAEDEYLAKRSPTTAPAASAQAQGATVTLRAGDWPGFRGAKRDGVLRGVSINTDWSKVPPRQVWRHPIGPGWSSMAIVDGRLFTQEQRGEHDVVVCMDAATGAEIWSHDEPGRFWDPLSSAGPRATPTFDNGKIYAQGATGMLLCIDAASGKKIWLRDVLADTNAKMPDWGVCASPVVTSGVVVTYGAGQGGKGLIAYKSDSGEIAWTVNFGIYSFSSPHLTTIGGVEQVLYISDAGIVSVEPASGKVLWKYGSAGQPPRSLQPLMIAEGKILVQLGLEAPADLIDVAKNGGAWAATKIWTTKNLKSPFNDSVLHDGYIYGFDNTFFCCVDAKTGEKKWRKGKYGAGQVMLVADQGMLVVLSEKGKVVLVAAKSDDLQELGSFAAIEGKTWNHPVIWQGKLYVRNSQEIACYEVK
jgi:outer membrane protein assembly factor BamB